MKQATIVLFLIATTLSVATSAEQRVDVNGATLRISIAPGIDSKKSGELVAWIEHTAKSIESVYGRFPVPRARVIVTAGREGRRRNKEAVQFGQVRRTNGGTIELFVNPERPIEEFYDDWTATHEFSHLMLPLLNREDRWISEGIATYYQNVLMARSGKYSEEKAWTRLLQGFERGRQSRPALSPRQAAANRSYGTTMKVYWSGASLALMADIELRRRSKGTQSLDTLLGELQECCLPARHKWSGIELFQRLDRFLEEPLFEPLYERYAETPGYPDPADLLHQLGVILEYGELQFANDADLVEIRNALMLPASI